MASSAVQPRSSCEDDSQGLNAPAFERMEVLVFAHECSSSSSSSSSSSVPLWVTLGPPVQSHVVLFSHFVSGLSAGGEMAEMRHIRLW
jgi:hypothetical protein